MDDQAPPEGGGLVAARSGDPGSTAAPVLIHTAREADARVLETALREAGMSVRLPGDPPAVAERIAEAGCLVIAQEGMTPAIVAAVGRALADQPAWSELPIVVLADRAADVSGLRAVFDLEWGEAQVTYLTRRWRPWF